MKQLRGKEVKIFFEQQPNRTHEIVMVLENIQYAINVANIFRTSEAAGVSKIYLTGISQKPPFGKALQKVSRNTELRVPYESCAQTTDILPVLKEQGFHVVAIELTDSNILQPDMKKYLEDKPKVCFVAGNEDSGVNRNTLEMCDTAVTIPMYGKNPSLNVNVSVGIILFSF